MTNGDPRGGGQEPGLWQWLLPTWRADPHVLATYPLWTAAGQPFWPAMRLFPQLSRSLVLSHVVLAGASLVLLMAVLFALSGADAVVV